MTSQTIKSHRAFRAVPAAFVVFFWAMIAANIAEMQAKQPYDKDKLIRVVQLNALPTSEVVQAIQQRGVDFKMTSDVESQFRAAGARPEVIDAIRSNYRGNSSPPPNNPSANQPNNTPASSRPNSSVPPGPPLAKNEIVTLLQSGVPPSRVEQFVEVRGVSFSITPQIAREIKDAGGNNSLIGAITAKANEPAPSSPSRPPVRPVPAGPDYDDLADKAVAAMQANNANGAIRFLQQAVALDASRPQAYGLLGFAELYGIHDINAAERSMRAAIERGGGAPFRVYHDHDRLFNTFCQGSLFVSKRNVTFRADDGNHTFEATRQDIKEAKLNGFVGAQFGAFHLKVGAGKGETYNFAPYNKQKSEANLVINLIQSYQ